MIASLRAFFLRLRGLMHNSRSDSEISEELQYDLEMRIEEGQSRGLSYTEARRQALIKLGGIEQAIQSVRDRRTLPALEAVLQDLRFALHQLRSRAGFSITAVLTLALGFGASIAIFAFVDAALVRPLPYADPNRLVWTTEVIELMGPSNLSLQDYQDWKQMAQSFESFGAWRWAAYILRTGNTSTSVSAMRLSANFLSTLGLRPQLGRDLLDSDNALGAPTVALIGDPLWRQQFAADPNIVGRVINLDGNSYTVIGVLPQGFEFAPRGKVDLVVAIQPKPGNCEADRGCHSLNGVARLKPGVTVQQADAEVQRIAAILQKRYPDTNLGQGAVAKPLAEESIGKIRPVLYILLSGALLLCAIACINVASLLLVRSESRTREFALRAALGASRGRLLRQFAVESAVLVLVGMLGGVVLANSAIHLLLAMVPQSMRSGMIFFAAVGWNRHIILFAAAQAIAAMAIFTLVPTLRISVTRLRNGLNEGNAGSGSLGWRRLGSMLVMLEVATAVVLMVGAGLLSRSLVNLLKVDLAFNPDHLVTMSMAASAATFKDDPAQLAIERAVVDRMRTLPGVASVGFGEMLPASNNGTSSWIRFVGRPYDGKHIEVNLRTASPTYFQTLGTPLLHGRLFTEDDVQGKVKLTIVNKRFADMYFPGEDAVGKQFGNTDLKPDSIRTIVGVIGDLHEGALDDDIWPAVYYPAYQDVDRTISLVVRVNGDEHAMLPMLSSMIRSFNPDLDTFDEVTMYDRIHDSQSAAIHRGAAWLAVAFAGLALLLCVIGLYGVVSYSVSLRTREIGVRMALGAQRSSIYRLVLQEACQLSASGVVIGVVMAVVLATMLRSILFHVSAWDAPTLAIAALLLAASSIMAALVPAYRAATCNPNQALRME